MACYSLCTGVIVVSGGVTYRSHEVNNIVEVLGKMFDLIPRRHQKRPAPLTRPKNQSKHVPWSSNNYTQRTIRMLPRVS